MDLFNFIFLLLCGIGVMNSVFFAFYLFFAKYPNISNKIFSFILLAFSIKIIKPIILFFNNEMFDYYHVIWFSMLSFLGPLLFLYVKSHKYDLTKFQYIDLLHLVLPVSILLQYNMSHHSLYAIILFYIILLQLIVYIILSFSLAKRNLEESFKSLNNLGWINILAGWMMFLPIIFLLARIFRFDFITTESFYYSVSIYLLLYYEFKNKNLTKPKYNKGLSNEIINSTYLKLTDKLEKEKKYLTENISLQELAKELHITHHILSRTINEKTGKNFNEFINSYRIEEAKKLIIDEKFQNLKIATIAYDCGFNSLSVFNSSFKKNTGYTPSEYQQKFSSRL
jgi:AraC-like DNA-binding protein